MRLYKLLLAAILAAFLSGCAPVDSLNPLYTDKDVIFDDSLLGQWGTEKEGLNFAKIGDDGYRIVWSGEDDDTGQVITTVFEGHMVSLQGHRLLDLVWKETGLAHEPLIIPEVHVTRTKSRVEIEPHLVCAGPGEYLELLPGESDGDEDRFSIRMRQAHEFFKVVLEDEGRTLKLVQLDDSWIDRQVQDGKLVIDHEILEGKSAVLTASTPDLQQLVLDYVDDEDAFKGDTTVQRPGADH